MPNFICKEIISILYHVLSLKLKKNNSALEYSIDLDIHKISHAQSVAVHIIFNPVRLKPSHTETVLALKRYLRSLSCSKCIILFVTSHLLQSLYDTLISCKTAAIINDFTEACSQSRQRLLPDQTSYEGDSICWT